MPAKRGTFYTFLLALLPRFGYACLMLNYARKRQRPDIAQIRLARILLLDLACLLAGLSLPFYLSAYFLSIIAHLFFGSIPSWQQTQLA